MNYIYYNDNKDRFILTDDGIDYNIDNNGRLRIKFLSENIDFETVREFFSHVTDITVYGCIVQEDGRETDEFVSAYFDNYTVLHSIGQDYNENVYTVELAIPDETAARLSELEDAINFLLMGGDE